MYAWECQELTSLLLGRLLNDGRVRVHYKVEYKTSSIFIASYTLNSHIIFELYIYTVHISVLVTSNLMDGRCCMQSGLICACVHSRCTPALAVLVLPHWASPIITCHSLVTLSSYGILWPLQPSNNFKYIVIAFPYVVQYTIISMAIVGIIERQK